jgi:hypothetical protein
MIGGISLVAKVLKRRFIISDIPGEYSRTTPLRGRGFSGTGSASFTGPDNCIDIFNRGV